LDDYSPCTTPTKISLSLSMTSIQTTESTLSLEESSSSDDDDAGDGDDGGGDGSGDDGVGDDGAGDDGGDCDDGGDDAGDAGDDDDEGSSHHEEAGPTSPVSSKEEEREPKEEERERASPIPTKAQSLRDKRRMMEAQHAEQKAKPRGDDDGGDDDGDDHDDNEGNSHHEEAGPTSPVISKEEERERASPIPTRAQSLRDKRRMMEAQHAEQKAKPRSMLALSPPKSPFSPTAGKRKMLTFRKNNKSENARSNRMIERLTEAEKQIEIKINEIATVEQEPGKQRMRAIQERAELKLRVSQIENTRKFYQQRLLTNSTGPVPMEILKVISDLPKYIPRQITLKEELAAFVKNLRETDPEEAALMFQEIRDWQDTEESALEVGVKAPDFSLRSRSGKMVDSHDLRRRSRLIVVFYHDVNSTMCKMNLTALERLRATFEREGAQLLAIGFEADTQNTASETGATFPLLADEAGIVATKFGIIRTEEFPILSTFILDTNGYILWKYVNCDYTQRPEPMDILEALPSQSKRRLKFFRRHDSH
jgi:peroxiredoxin